MTNKILVIRLSSIGDIVLTTPVLRGLKNQIGAEVHVVAKKGFAALLESNPYVDKVLALEEDLHVLIAELKRENYDQVIDLHHNLRSQRIKLALGVPSSSFSKLNIEKWLLVNLKINRLPELHIVDRYMAAVLALGVKNDGQGLDFFIPAEKKVDVETEFGCKPGAYATIVIGAAHQTKCLTATQIARLCDELDMPVILVGGKDEMQKAEDIRSSTKNLHVQSGAGRLDIMQSASVIHQSGPIISHDTGMMHVAAALQKPQVVIWGNTIPEFGMYPYYGDSKVKWISFEQKELKCRPCSKLGYDRCPKGHFKCMLDHDIGEIASKAISLVDADLLR